MEHSMVILLMEVTSRLPLQVVQTMESIIRRVQEYVFMEVVQ